MNTKEILQISRSGESGGIREKGNISNWFFLIDHTIVEIWAI